MKYSNIDFEYDDSLNNEQFIGIGLLGCVCIYALLNLMAVSGVAICKYFYS